MRITDVKIHLVKLDGKRPIKRMFIIPQQTRWQFDRRVEEGQEDNLMAFIRIFTDAKIEGWCDAVYTWGPTRAFAETWLDAFRHELIGTDPLNREFTFQKL